MSPVSRLKKTWGKAKTAKFFILEVKWCHSLKAQNFQSCEDDWRCVCVACRGCATASDGSYWELLQLQDGPEGGSTPLSDCQQQQREGEGQHLEGLWNRICNPDFSPVFFASADCNPLLQSADQRHLLSKRRMCKPAAQWPRQLWGESMTSPLCLHVVLKAASLGTINWCGSPPTPLEICGTGPPGRGVHDVETGGVPVWGGSLDPALPPHRAHLQRRR